MYDRVLAFCQPNRARSYLDPQRNHDMQYMTMGANFRMNGMSAVLIADQLRHLDAIRETWIGACDVLRERIADLEGFILPEHDEASTCWYKIPVILPSDDAIHVEALKKAMAPFDVGVDPTVKPFFALPGYPFQQVLAAFPNYQALHRRVQILDLSKLVAKRYRVAQAALHA